MDVATGVRGDAKVSAVVHHYSGRHHSVLSTVYRIDVRRAFIGSRERISRTVNPVRTWKHSKALS